MCLYLKAIKYMNNLIVVIYRIINYIQCLLGTRHWAINLSVLTPLTFGRMWESRSYYFLLFCELRS